MEVYDGDVYHGWAEYVVYGGLTLTVMKNRTYFRKNLVFKLKL